MLNENNLTNKLVNILLNEKTFMWSASKHFFSSFQLSVFHPLTLLHVHQMIQLMSGHQHQQITQHQDQHQVQHQGQRQVQQHVQPPLLQQVIIVMLIWKILIDVYCDMEWLFSLFLWRFFGGEPYGGSLNVIEILCKYGYGF